MKPDESFYPSDWFRIAEKDLIRVTQLLEVGDPEAAGFFLQQATEKFIKGFLLSHGWKLERIHDLEPLLNSALKFDASLERYRQVCQKITGYYFIERYPFITESGLTIDDIKNSLNQVAELIKLLKSQV